MAEKAQANRRMGPKPLIAKVPELMRKLAGREDLTSRYDIAPVLIEARTGEAEINDVYRVGGATYVVTKDVRTGEVRTKMSRRADDTISLFERELLHILGGMK
jgi:hypothetical protein